MAALRGGRYLAPVALVAAAVALFLIVQGHLGTTHATTPSPGHSIVRASTTTKGTPSTKPSPSSSAKVYVVKSGDTLSGIAQQTGVTVNKLETLNPSVNPNALQTGQRLRLQG